MIIELRVIEAHLGTAFLAIQGREKRLVNLVKQDPGKARQNS